MKIEAIEYKGQKLRRFEPSPEELKKLASAKYDFYWNKLTSEIRVIWQEGEIINHYGDIRKIGPTRMMFLDALLSFPGIFLSHWDIGKLCEKHYGAEQSFKAAVNSNFVKSNIVASVHLLRAHVFRSMTNYFLKTRRSPYGVTWNKSRNFLIIQPKRSES